MIIRREWATPVTIGAFLLTAVTGVLLFFHMDTGANKVVHEWLGLALVVGAAFHVAANATALKRYFTSRLGLSIIGLFVVILLASFFPLGEGGKGEPPFAASVHALARAPLGTLSQVSHVSFAQVQQQLSEQGIQAATEQQSLEELIGPDLGRQMMVLKRVLEKKS